MPSRSTIRSIAHMYLVGLTWLAVLTLSTLALAEPLTSTSGLLSIASPQTAAVVGMALAVLIATAAAAAVSAVVQRLVPAAASDSIGD